MKRYIIGGLLAAAAALLFSTVNPAHAAPQTFTVTTGTDELNGDCATTSQSDFTTAGDGLSLREAICLANRTLDEDTILLTGNAELGLLGSNDDANLTGDLDITQPLIIQGDPYQGAIIDGFGGGDRSLHSIGTRLTLRDITISEGNAVNGGGIFAGGGAGSALILERSSVEGAISTDKGGGILSQTETTIIRDSLIADNSADGGGGLFAGGIVTIERTGFTGNSAEAGGAIQGSGSAATFTITDSTFYDNSATSTSTGGGAIHNGGAVFTLEQVTMVENTLDEVTATGSAIFVTMGGGVDVGNSIIAGNSPAGTQCDTILSNPNAIQLADYNLVQPNSGCTAGSTDVESTQALADLLGPRVSQGITVGDYIDLTAGSDAIDAGQCDTAPDRDQRRIERSLIDGTCDIGAVEYYTASNTYVVDSTGTAGDAELGDLICDDGTGSCTLQAAFEQTEVAHQQDTIVLQPGMTYTPDKASLKFYSSVAMQGNGATVDGSSINDRGADNLFEFRGETTFIDGLAAINAIASNIRISGEQTTIVNVLVAGGNRGLDFNGSSAGTAEVINVTAVSNDEGLYRFTDTTFVNVIARDNNVINLSIPASLPPMETLNVTVSHSNIEGGLPTDVTDGGNNVDVDPQFVDPSTGDYRLSASSPVRDAGSSAALPADVTDRDGDGDTTEPVPFDLQGTARVHDAVVDMGAYEFRTLPDGDPTNLTATYDGDADAIDLAWEDNAGNETGYAIERSTDSGTTWSVLTTVAADAEAYSDTNVDCETGYTYRVQAVNTVGVSAYTNEASAATGSCLPDADPTGLTATYAADDYQVQLNWTDNASNETGYIVQRQKPGAAEWQTLNTTGANAESYLDESVTCDQQYVYRVLATNTFGDSSPAVSATVDTPCDIFDDLTSLPAPFMEPWVEDFFRAGITQGKAVCDDGAEPAPGETFYCGSDPVTRADMAVFIIRALEYPSLPYDPTGTTPDPFADVPENLPAPFMEDWVEEFLRLEITTGKAVCDDGTSGPNLYCPQDNVTRADMAVFILRALGVTVGNVEPNPFADVPEDLPAPFMEPFVETFLQRGITTGKAQCDDGSTPGPDETFYCPQDEVTRGDMAVFILRAFDSVPDPNDP